MPTIFSFHQILRYGFGGFLLLGLVLWNEARVGALADAPHFGQSIKAAIDAAGPILGPMVIFAIGAAIYVMYRFLLGEYLLYPLSHFLDWATSRRNRSKTRAISPIWHLRQLGVPMRSTRDAYSAVRRQCTQPGIRDRLDLAHAEAHVIYLTAIVLIPFGYWSGLLQLEIVGGLVLLAALFNDVRLHREEFPAYLQSLNDTPGFLEKQGFLRSKQP